MSRRPNGTLPANPTEDQIVSFSLCAVEMAVEDAIQDGATEDELHDLVSECVFRLGQKVDDDGG